MYPGAYTPSHTFQFLFFPVRSYDPKNYILIWAGARERRLSIDIIGITIGARIKKFIFRDFGIKPLGDGFARH